MSENTATQRTRTEGFRYAECTYSTMPGSPEVEINTLAPMPGVIIFVHGVNSDGEWYDAAEEGLCKGLNTRMSRELEQLHRPDLPKLQMKPVQYREEITPAGYLDPRLKATNFVKSSDHYSPVIRFRWGYKACKEELAEYGPKIMLNEQDFWGGGPFAAGCTSLPDLWNDGVNDRLFLFILAQHLNTAPGREVYSTPHRAYMVHAAVRLAHLIKSIRDKQADCPITVVCHSQGNMVGLAAAFLADRIGVQADNYILCNAPYSLVSNLGADNWAQRNVHNKQGEYGRQTGQARVATLKTFFEMMRKRIDAPKPDALMCQITEFPNPKVGEPFTFDRDKGKHGLNGSTHGRVTLYCCPHDQVISIATIQGMGWSGLTAKEIELTNGQGVFTQRVFAQGYRVGQATGQSYDYYQHHWRQTLLGHKVSPDSFWYPPSPPAKMQIVQGWKSSSTLGKIATFTLAPIALLVKGVTTVVDIPSNASPDAKKGWTIPIEAPPLPSAFYPSAVRLGQTRVWVKDEQRFMDSRSEAVQKQPEAERIPEFDGGRDPAGNYLMNAETRQAVVGRQDADPYSSHSQAAPLRTAEGDMDDSPQGDVSSEAQLRYEHHAQLRMQARRDGLADENNSVPNEENLANAPKAYHDWRNQHIAHWLQTCVDQNATDHSTTVTNPMHAEKAMAYDVAMGVCMLNPEDWHDLRVEANWKVSKGLGEEHPHWYFSEYFGTGKMGGTSNDKGEFEDGQFLHKWIEDTSGPATMPSTITDERSNKPPKNNPEDRS